MHRSVPLGLMLLSVLVNGVCAQQIKPDRSVTFSITNLQCAGCKKALEDSIKKVAGVTTVSTDVKAKTAAISYDHHLTSVARLATHLANIKSEHGKPLEGALLLAANDLSKENSEKLVTTLKTLKNVEGTAEPIANASADVDRKLVHVTFKPVKLDTKDRGIDINRILIHAKKSLPSVKAVGPEAMSKSEATKKPETTNKQ